MTEAVVAAIEPAIRKADLQLARRKPPENLDAYDRYLQALPLVYSLHRENVAKAFELLEKAIALDSNYSAVLALSAWCLEQGIVRGWPQQTGDDRALCIERATAALSLDSDDANAIAMAGFALQMVSPEFDAGNAVVDRALALNANSEIVVVFSGLICIFAGDVDRAQQCFEKALALNPADAGNTIPYFGIAAAHFSRGDYEQACRFGTRSAALNPKRESIYWILSAAYGLLGRGPEAQKAIEKLVSLNPEASQSLFRRTLPFRDRAVKSALLRGMNLAGLPE
jgi:tetratricopeptide (TPR) repeat protein